MAPNGRLRPVLLVYLVLVETKVNRVLAHSMLARARNQ